MAKRFTDTNKYRKPFLRGLQGPYKLLWDFICNDCDNAGIWIVDFEITQLILGVDMSVNKADALRLFNSEDERIVEIDHGKKWFIRPFIEFQYGQLSKMNRAHIGVISALLKYDLIDANLNLKSNKVHTSPLQGAKDMDMDKEQEKDKEKESVESSESTLDVKLDSALDQMFIASIRSQWSHVDFDQELIAFKQKVRGSPDVYIHRDSSGIRLAFQHQLRHAKTKKDQFKTPPKDAIKRTAANAIIERGREFGKFG